MLFVKKWDDARKIQQHFALFTVQYLGFQNCAKDMSMVTVSTILESLTIERLLNAVYNLISMGVQCSTLTIVEWKSWK